MSPVDVMTMVKKLEQRTSAVEQILPTLATKEDLKAFATKEDLKAFPTRAEMEEKFEEAKRFPFKPNSAYAFAVSDSAKRKSWHGRDRLTGFAGVRNTLMVLFQRVSPRDYSM